MAGICLVGGPGSAVGVGLTVRFTGRGLWILDVDPGGRRRPHALPHQVTDARGRFPPLVSCYRLSAGVVLTMHSGLSCLWKYHLVVRSVQLLISAQHGGEMYKW